MGGLTIIGPAEQLVAMLRNLASEVEKGRIGEATLTNNGPGSDLTLSCEPDESEPELGLTAEKI